MHTVNFNCIPSACFRPPANNFQPLAVTFGEIPAGFLLAAIKQQSLKTVCSCTGQRFKATY